MAAHTFSKAERLNSKKLIQELFTKGSSFYMHPFKVLTLHNLEGKPNFSQVLISVSKRNFKKAVDRNLLKRRIKEAYRLEKEMLKNKPTQLLALLYTSKTVLSSKDIHHGLENVLKKISRLE